MAKFVPIVSTNKNGDLFKIFIIYHSSFAPKTAHHPVTSQGFVRSLWFLRFSSFQKGGQKKRLEQGSQGRPFPTFLTHMKNKLSCLPGLSFRFVCQAALKMHAEGSLSAGVFLYVCVCVSVCVTQILTANNTQHSSSSQRQNSTDNTQTNRHSVPFLAGFRPFLGRGGEGKEGRD